LLKILKAEGKTYFSSMLIGQAIYSLEVALKKASIYLYTFNILHRGKRV